MNLLVICLDPSLVDYLVILMELRGFEGLMGFWILEFVNWKIIDFSKF